MKRKYCELNLLESPSQNENISNIKQLIKFGYNVVCINRRMKPPEKVNKNSPKMSQNEMHSFANVILKLQTEVNALRTSPDVDFDIPDDFQLLSRITVELTHPDQVRLLRNMPYKDMLNNVDIISICPKDENIFKVIAEGKIDCDLISFQLEEDLEYKPTREMVGLAAAKNISYEISYSHAIKSISLRKYVFKNGIFLVQRNRRGKYIVLSSQGSNVLDLRSPQDVINLAHLFGVNDTICHDVVSKNCWSVITHSRLRKATFKGAVAVEKIIDSSAEEEDDVSMDTTTTTPAKKKQRVEV